MLRLLRWAPRAELISRRMGLASLVVPASTHNQWLTCMRQKIKSQEVANVLGAPEGAECMQLVQSMYDHSEELLFDNAAKDERLAGKDEALAGKDEALARTDKAVAAMDKAVAAMDQIVAAKDQIVSLQNKAITDLETRTPQNHPLLGRPRVTLSCLSRARYIRRYLPERSEAVEARGYPARALHD